MKKKKKSPKAFYVIVLEDPEVEEVIRILKEALDADTAPKLQRGSSSRKEVLH
jgi:hypothetical protein